jgi:hypothetical protein
MKMGKITIAVIGSILLVLGITPFSNAAKVHANFLKVQTENGIPFVSGGFGVEERAALQTLGTKDNLELSFALQNDEYLGGAKVLIKDERGEKVLETASDGPLFYAKLPTGTYTVMATALGKTMTRTVKVPATGRARLYFAWNSARAERRLAKK